MCNVIGVDGEVIWETTLICKEYEDVNPITVRTLERDSKYVYTFITKNSPVRATEIFERFKQFEVEKILYDLRGMHLVYFKREVK